MAKNDNIPTITPSGVWEGRVYMQTLLLPKGRAVVFDRTLAHKGMEGRSNNKKDNKINEMEETNRWF